MTSLLVVRPGPLAWAKEVRIDLVIPRYARDDRGCSGGLGPVRGRAAPCAPPRNCVRGDASRKIEPRLNATSGLFPLANTRTPARSTRPRGRPRDRGDTSA